MSKSKNYISLMLLILLLLVSNGYYMYFRYLQFNLQQSIKTELIKGVNQNELTLIIVPKKYNNKINWIKKGKEFKYKGSMYDIVKIEIINNSFYYYCINDIKEKELITNFYRNRRRNKKILQLKKIITTKYFKKKYTLNINIKSFNVIYKEYNQIYSSHIIEILSPPPKFNFFT